MDTIPLFPLGVVLFPGMPLPLHIFEERYKQMISLCLENDMEFGIVYYTGENFYKVGCTAKIRSVIKRFDDGRSDILTVGKRRFVIARIIQDKPYLVGEVDWVEDTYEDELELKEVCNATIKLFQESLKLAKRDKVSELDIMDSVELSFFIAATAGFSLNEKQALLEMTSTHERLKKSSSALHRLIDRVKTTKEIESLISGNGHLHNKKF